MGRHPNRHHPISIHTPRGGATTVGGYLRPSTANFNPPAPCGAGPFAAFRTGRPHSLFQSTCPVWGRTVLQLRPDGERGYFNPPAPCGAGRPSGSVSLPTTRHFNPPAPCGAGRRRRQQRGRHLDFNPPAPCGAGLPKPSVFSSAESISIHLPRVGQDVCCTRLYFSLYISIHLPRVGQDFSTPASGLGAL